MYDPLRIWGQPENTYNFIFDDKRTSVFWVNVWMSDKWCSFGVYSLEKVRAGNQILCRKPIKCLAGVHNLLSEQEKKN